MDQLILPLLLALLFVPLILSYRRQRRQFSDMQRLQGSLQVGDDVMTTSGLRGTIIALADETVDLEIAPGVVTTWIRQAVRERIENSADSADAADTEVAAEDDVADRR